MKYAFSMLGAAAVVGIAAVATATTGVAQDSIAARIDEAQVRYEQASVSGDAPAMRALFTEDALYMPLFGGMFSGGDAIEGYFGNAPAPASLDIVSSHWEWAGDYIIDVGTFTLVVPPQGGGATITGEYTAVVEEIDGAFLLRHLATFATRSQ